jgi:thioredoxin reductase (NADPH)
MTGYQPPFEFMESMGIRFGDDADHTPVYDEVTMETNVPGIFLAGVVCGGLRTNKWFIENSRVHAEMIVKAIRKESFR